MYEVVLHSLVIVKILSMFTKSTKKFPMHSYRENNNSGGDVFWISIVGALTVTCSIFTVRSAGQYDMKQIEWSTYARIIYSFL